MGGGYSVYLSETPEGAARNRLTAWVMTHSALERSEVLRRLESPPVLLARQVSRDGANRVVYALASRGGRLAVRSTLSGLTLAGTPPVSCDHVLAETLKPTLASALGAHEAVLGLWRAATGLSPVEYPAMGGLPSWLARQVALVATDQRILVVALGARRRPTGCLLELRPTSSRLAGSRLELCGSHGEIRSFSGLSGELGQTLAAHAHRPTTTGPFERRLCHGCGAVAEEADGACRRCGTLRRSARGAALRSAVLPGWSHYREGRRAAAAAAVAGSAIALGGLALWTRLAVEAGVAGAAWFFPAAAWLGWSAAHALAEWTRVRDETLGQRLGDTETREDQ